VSDFQTERPSRWIHSPHDAGSPSIFPRSVCEPGAAFNAATDGDPSISKPSVRSSMLYATALNRAAVTAAAPTVVCAVHLTRHRLVRHRQNPSPLASASQRPENAGSIPAASIGLVKRTRLATIA
jgi:hypothetical protein